MQDKELWKLYTVSMGKPSQKVSEKDKEKILAAVLRAAGGESVRQPLNTCGVSKMLSVVMLPGLGWVAPALATYSICKQPLPQGQCPKEGVPCSVAEFDNLKVFYRPVTFTPNGPA